MFRLLPFIALLVLFTSLSGCSKGADQAELDSSGAIKEKVSGDSVAVEVNSPAPAFAAKVLGGGELKLSDHVGKVVLLEFWSVFCKSCIEEMPSVKVLHERYKSRGFEVISVNTDVFSDSRVQKVLNKAGIVLPYPVVRDLRKEVSVAYNVELLPVTVLIDRSGWIRLYQEGYRPGDEARFERLIVKHLDREAEEDVTLAPRGGVTKFTASSSLKPRLKLDKPLRLPTSNGGEVVVGGGSGSVLFFWSLYCQPCREELPNISALGAEGGGKDLQFIAVNVDSDKLAGKVSKFLTSYPQLIAVTDPGVGVPGSYSELFGISATPTVVMVDGAGSVVFSGSGEISAAELAKELPKLAKSGR